MSRSPRDTVEALKRLIRENFEGEESVQKGHRLCDEMMDHVERKSLFMKMMGLVTCRNIVMILAVVTGIAFVFALFHDLAIIFGGFFRRLLEHIWRFVLKKNVALFLGFLTAVLSTFFKKHKIIGRFYIFEDYTALFGSIMFSISFRYWLNVSSIEMSQDLRFYGILPTIGPDNLLHRFSDFYEE